MAIIVPDEVFDFVQCADDQRETHHNQVSQLIEENEAEMIRVLKREIYDTTLSSQIINEGEHFEFNRDYTKIMLKGKYVDLYSLTAVTEEGTALTASTSYNDGGTYRFNSRTAEIIKLSGTWSTSDLAITISGKYGYVDSYGQTREDLKLILKQMVSMLSGLWKKTFISDGGDVTVQKDEPRKWFKDQLRGHINHCLL